MGGCPPPKNVDGKNNTPISKEFSSVTSILSLDPCKSQTSPILLQLDGNISIDECLSVTESTSDDIYIPVLITNRLENACETSGNGTNLKNLITVKRNNRLLEASVLPIVLNLNPRSLYNKTNEFRTLIEQTDAGVCCISETWDRSHTLNSELISEKIEIEDFKWVKNPVQRNRKGGKPAILISEKEFHVTELCPEIITVPLNVEVIWALLTPKVRGKFRHIVVAAVYYSSTQTKKSDFLDHICNAYQILCSKYGENLGFIIAGDFNRLNVKPILNLSADLRQTVSVPTRLNPDATLDLVITNMANFYQAPCTLAPLENDDSKSGTASDHLIVKMHPIRNSSNVVERKYRTIQFRPFPDSGIREFGRWLHTQTWNAVYYEKCPSKKGRNI